ncbi:MAG TPA: 4Fe-4S dicluster domain-containing protein [Planctomycetota bacterium]|nr:4Fe-4S dicluster domain-containing protein [Planctomycetota bacterium]
MADTVDLYADVPKVPDKYATKKKKPKEIAVVNPGNCTGCEICVPFCPVNCIEVSNPKDHPDRPIPPVYVREDECIGCTICARVCTKMAWDAISMIPTAEVEKAIGKTLSEKFIPEKKPA